MATRKTKAKRSAAKRATTGRKQTSPNVSSYAAKLLQETQQHSADDLMWLSVRDVRMLAASLLGQDETKGRAGITRRK